ncbi:MAG: chorismate mutase [Bacteroidota bacterium]
MIQPLSQKALDLNFNGLMIESHINPDKALSDAKQQVTPERLGEILNDLIYRQDASDDPGFVNKLELLRESIDELDHILIEKLAQRMDIARQIGMYKKENNITILQRSRWDEIIKDRILFGKSRGLSEDILTEILKMIHQESIRHQVNVMNETVKTENSLNN